MAKKTLFVLGGGSAGVRLARRMSDWQVILADPLPLGGTCVNRGCIPKKLFAYAASCGGFEEDCHAFGWREARLGSLDWGCLRDRVAREIKRLNGLYSKTLSNAGVTVLPAAARFASADEIVCGDQAYRFDRAVIATGGQPRQLTIPGGELAIDSDRFFNLPSRPSRAIVLGGGYIALELASILHGFGCQTTVIHRSNRFLRGFEAKLVSVLLSQMSKRGIRMLSETAPKTLRRTKQGIEVICEDETFLCDEVVAAIGREPNLANVAPDMAGIALNHNGTVQVDAQMRTTNPKVYALGDAVGYKQLTPVALGEAEMLSRHLRLDEAFQAPPYASVPSAAFTEPEIASVGLTTNQVDKKSRRIYEAQFRSLRHVLRDKASPLIMRLICDREDTLLGAHMLGSEAAELIQMLAPLVQIKANKRLLDQSIGIHPSIGEEFFVLREEVREDEN